MDFLNKSISQVSELFASMTPGARITAGLLLATVVISLGYLLQQGTAGPDAYLFGGQALSEGELNRVEAAIAQAGLSGCERDGNRLRVPAGQKAAYLAAVADAGALPPNFNTILEDALDKAGPWETREATRERIKIGTQRFLAEVVRSMDWVDEAAVLYNEQQSRDPRNLNLVKQITASVNVRPIVGESLDPRRELNLKKLVAGAVGMRTEDVVVINLGDGSGGIGGDMFPEMFEKSEYMQTKVAFEMQKRASIMNTLRDIPGVRVEVNAELDNVVEERTRGIKPDPKAVAAAREITSTDSTTQTTSDGGGRPGLEAQGPNRRPPNTPPAQAPQVKNVQSSDSTDTQNVVGVEETSVLKHGLTPKEVWATVTIPGKYVEGIWKQRNPTVADPPKPEDLRAVQSEVVAKVENIVEPLLLLTAIKGQNTYKHVKVEVIDSLPAPAIEPPSVASTAMAWTGRYWSTLAMLGVAVFSLLVLRSVVRGTPPAEGAVANGAPTLTLHTEEPAAGPTESGSEEAADRPRLRLKKGKSLKDDLVEIVREDPDAAAEILRSWIGKAG